eukprot:CAMPEP_0173461790 /NCGR_PEP_ID=MMETSP1357-20121228/65537_1 /TAXON_ID=77926 /ORGANISM="Hemiselmis rufescens, Strain PCC563" /LENGTH=37 /DNA_ID=CAMNT_0014429471 /DNA_START=1 /DNA_END=114 /DNA_ORIENTATION=+
MLSRVRMSAPIHTREKTGDLPSGEDTSAQAMAQLGTE